MKKISLYITCALAGLFMSSCSSEHEDWAEPQSNPQEDAITLPGFQATAVAPQTLTAETESVPVFTLSTAALPDGYELANARVELTPQGVDGATATEVTTTLDGMAAEADLQSLIETAYGKNPVARTFDAHVYVNAVKNGQAALIDAGTIAYTVTTVTPDIAQAYYIVGGPNDWESSAKDRTIKFDHSATNVYDDPVFTVTFKVADTTQDCWFAIGDDEACDAVGNNVWNLLYGSKTGNGTNAIDGTTEQLDRRVNLGADNTFKVPAGTQYVRVEINMMELTYKITALNFSEYIYEVGNNTDWANNPLVMYGPNFDGKYYGAFYLNGEFKFKPNAGNDWTGDWEYDGDGKLTADGSQNIPAPTTGFYFVTVDLSAMTYSLKQFNEMRVVGDAAPGGWDNGNAMTWNATDKTWELKNVTLNAGKIKFRSDADWSSVNLGSSLDKLVQNGSDISVTAGTYNIILHLENKDRAPYAELVSVN